MHSKQKQIANFALMKKYLFLPLLFCSAFVFQNCESDFQVTSDWKEITIAYAILDANDTDHFIRIQKAFLDEETSALEIAEENDSLYHQGSLLVEMDEYDEDGDWRGKDTFKMVNVNDSTQFEFEKEAGTFANNPYFLYHIEKKLFAGHKYNLKITTPTGNVLRSETRLIGDFDIWRPNGTREIILFADRVSENSIQQIVPYARWDRPEGAFISGLSIRFFYSEEINDVTTNKTLDWNIFDTKEVDINETSIRYNFDMMLDNRSTTANEYKNEFFYFLAEEMEVNSFASRQIDSLNFIFSFGAESLYDYTQSIAAQQSGIAGGGQGIKTFTNIENGLGLFTCRSSKTVYRLKLDSETRDSLYCNWLTRDLNFVPAISNPRCK